MDSPQDVTHISLCAGYGGIDLGLRRVIQGLRTIAASEIEAFACANLVAKMEAGLLDSAPIWTDLRTFPWRRFRDLVDLLSGGFPCQPFSAAGKRGGDEDPRHLFPHILRGITECQPRFVFLENVEGIISAKLSGDGWRDPAGTPVLLHVLRELERVGYRATAGVFSSAEAGASHQRKRIFILAMAHHHHHQRLSGHRQPRNVHVSEGRQAEGRCVTSGSVDGGKQAVRLCRPLPPGPDQWWWEPSRVICDSVRIANRHRRFVGDAKERHECGEQGRGVGARTEAYQGRETDNHISNGSGADSPEAMGNTSDVLSYGSDHHAPVSLGSGSLPQSGDTGRASPVDDPSGLRVEGQRPEQQAAGSLQSGGLRWAEIRQTEPSLGGDLDGSTYRLDYAELCQTVDSRIDELRLLGNGVDPDVAARAFAILYNRLTEQSSL